MKTRITVAFALVLALLLSLSFPAFALTGALPTAEEIENSGMEDLDELLRLREELAREKEDLDRRIAAENRMLSSMSRNTKCWLCSFAMSPLGGWYCRLLTVREYRMPNSARTNAAISKLKVYTAVSSSLPSDR